MMLLNLNCMKKIVRLQNIGGRKMAWDYRSYVKPYENYIVKDKDGKYEVNGSPYKQIGLNRI